MALFVLIFWYLTMGVLYSIWSMPRIKKYLKEDHEETLRFYKIDLDFAAGFIFVVFAINWLPMTFKVIKKVIEDRKNGAA